MDLSCLSEYSSQPLIISDSSDDENQDPLPPNKRMRRSNYIYKRVASFNDLESAQQMISTLEGSDKLCDARAYIQLPETSTLFIVHKTDLPHSHSEKPKRGISLITKEAINDLVQKGVRKPQQLLEDLVEMKIETPTYQQLTNYLKRYKAQITRPIQTYADLELAIEPLKKFPSSDDSPYVVNSYFDHQSGVARIFWSTKRLLQLTNCSDLVSIDATYKLVWQNWPVIITGTIDKAKRFHPFSFCLVPGETSIDYEFAFSTFKIANPSYKPTVLLADAACSITNAFHSVFGADFIRLNCFFHVKKNLKERIRSVDYDGKEKIMLDIDHLQLCRSEAEFAAACNLFFSKWKKETDNKSVNEFLDYFKQNYVDQRSKWFEGAAVGYPKTNNGIEATNRHVKERATFRRKLPLPEFIAMVNKLVQNWSNERNTEHNHCKYFVSTPPVDTKLATLGYKYSKQFAQLVSTITEDNTTFYIFPSTKSSHKRVAPADLSKYLKNTKNFNYRTFYTFVKNHLLRLWVVTFNDGPDWRNTNTCNCPDFYRSFICKHIVCVAIIRKQYEVPIQAMTLPLNTRRQPGRPAKVSDALSH